MRMDEVVSMAVALESTGRAKGVEEGGILEIQRTEINIQCLPGQIPSAITFDVSELNLHESIHIKDIQLPEGVTIDDDPEQVVASIVAKVEVPVEEEAPAEGEEGEVPEEGAEPAEGEKKEDEKPDKGDG